MYCVHGLSVDALMEHVHSSSPPPSLHFMHTGSRICHLIECDIHVSIDNDNDGESTESINLDSGGRGKGAYLVEVAEQVLYQNDFEE